MGTVLLRCWCMSDHIGSHATFTSYHVFTSAYRHEVSCSMLFHGLSKGKKLINSFCFITQKPLCLINDLLYLHLKQSLELSKAAQGKTTVGQMINLMGLDSIRFDTNLLFLAYLVIGPIQLAIFGYFLWQEVGPSSLAGIGFVVFLIPIECKLTIF